MANGWGKMEAMTDFIFLGSKVTTDADCSHEIKGQLLLGRKDIASLDTVWKIRDIHFANKGPYSQSYGFFSGHVQMWELDHKEGWVPKNWYFWTVVLEKTLESPLDCKEIQPVHPKGDQSWVFIGRTDVEAETPNFGHLMQRTDSFEETLMLGKIEGGKRRGWQRIRWLDSITDSMDTSLNSGSWWWTGKPGMLQSMESQRVGHYWVTELSWILWLPDEKCQLTAKYPDVGKDRKQEKKRVTA